MPSPAVELEHVIEAVRHSFPLTNLVLPDEFFPAHLSVALIDAALDSRGENSESAVPASERYCRWAGIARTRADRWNKPLPEAQESLTDMIGRFDELGDRRVAEKAFRKKQLLSGASVAGMESVPRAARALRRAGIEVLQDVEARQSEEIERTLRDCASFGEAATRLFLMYAGTDDFVHGDGCVRRFVAGALGRTEISAARAKRLVRSCAYELVLSPRYLDDQIWRRRPACSLVG